MQKTDMKRHNAFLYAALVVIAAAVLRQIGFLVNEPLDLIFILLRAALYIGFFVTWGISVRNRIIQPQVRRYLTAISTLMVFWMAVRTVRHLKSLRETEQR